MEPPVNSLIITAPVNGARVMVSAEGGGIALWCSNLRTDAPALLLIHSVNATASAFEVQPLYDHYTADRSVFALELPGFGHSDKPRGVYTTTRMIEAIHATVDHLKLRGFRSVDVVALSLSCEFVALAEADRPNSFRSIALISPTGFESNTSIWIMRRFGGFPLLRKLLDYRLWSSTLFRAMTRPVVIRGFLQKTWGSTDIDEELLSYDCKLVRQPGAEHAPFSFIAGYLFTRKIMTVYQSLNTPVWVATGSRGDFVNYHYLDRVLTQRNWSHSKFDSGAFPHFEVLPEVVDAYDEFLKAI